MGVHLNLSCKLNIEMNGSKARNQSLCEKENMKDSKGEIAKHESTEVVLETLVILEAPLNIVLDSVPPPLQNVFVFVLGFVSAPLEHVLGCVSAP